VITATPDGGTIWKNYASGSAHRIVVIHGDENPNDVAAGRRGKKEGAGDEH
jgi:hypothetical protein